MSNTQPPVTVVYSIVLSTQITLRIKMEPSTVVTKKFLFVIDRPVIAVNVTADLLADEQAVSEQSYTVYLEGIWDAHMADGIVRMHINKLVDNAYVRGRPYNPLRSNDD
jgi:hypothetical protein